MSTVRVALIGMGRMGRAIDALAAERGCEVVARLGTADTRGGIDAALLQGAQVAIDFTTSESALTNAAAVLAARVPLVLGTTGWNGEEQLSQLSQLAREHDTPVLWSPNFSLGVQLFLAVAEELGRRLRGHAAFDTHLVETHHTAKKDAPSGTGLALQLVVSRGLGRDVPISSVRVGSVPGTHEVIADAPFEQLRFSHEARDRRVFADGALTAARWLADRAAGATGVARVYTMQDMIAEENA